MSLGAKYWWSEVLKYWWGEVVKVLNKVLYL